MNSKKSISLAAKYRPQNFASVVGQETITSILSKAAFEQKVAPAYLLSGTRGVGKTTIARIFAKALNCETASSRINGEPCNKCQSCLKITQNAFVDVMEIDGASNRGIEDAKKIREIVQYPPLEGRFKIIIIDEAHMLTKEAFNALLKTFEEPPSYTSFILATTEAHKFPITIVSRCQHFVFKQVPPQSLEKHLKNVLDNENWQYEDEAISLLIRRASGSVRDAMSLLGQTLVLAQNPLTSETTRSVLGLAGKEILERILTAIHENNSLAIAEAVEDMMQQGIDIIYFMRELSQIWRSLYLIKEYKERSFKLLSLSQDEIELYTQYAHKFSASFIHSAWQITLESQRRISTSLEPSIALELFLINLALLPTLLPLHELQADISFQQEKKNVDSLEENTKKNEKVEEEKKKFNESLYTEISTAEKAITKPEKANVLSDIPNNYINSDNSNPSDFSTNKNHQENFAIENFANEEAHAKEIIAEEFEIVENIQEEDIFIPSQAKENIFIPLADEQVFSFEEIQEERNNQQEEELAEKIEDTKERNEDEIKNIDYFNYQAFLDFLIANKHTANNSATQNLQSILLHNLKVCDGDFSFDSTSQSHVLTLKAPSAICAKDLKSAKLHTQLLKEAQNFNHLFDDKLIVKVQTKAKPKNTADLLEELEQKSLIQEIKKTFNAHIVHCESKKIG